MGISACVVFLCFIIKHLHQSWKRCFAFQDQAHRNKLSAYRVQLGLIIFSCLAFLGFELGDRGMQLTNPTYTLWKHPNLAFGLLVCGCLAGSFYFLLLCYLVFRVFRSIRFKCGFILTPERSNHFTVIVTRFKLLMALTVGTAGLTVAFFILQQVRMLGSFLSIFLYAELLRLGKRNSLRV